MLNAEYSIQLPEGFKCNLGNSLEHYSDPVFGDETIHEEELKEEEVLGYQSVRSGDGGGKRNDGKGLNISDKISNKSLIKLTYQHPSPSKDPLSSFMDPFD